MITGEEAEELRVSIEAAMAGDTSLLPTALKVAEALLYDVLPEWAWENGHEHGGPYPFG